ncbi:DUF3482 domain-containing protein [Saccharospirillum impatiens]|uniref:DUF3482 domain-containing protein n=1 Tax=Saccharospirillum impatiens TaxID=169438 RepID=UPI0004045B8D|nr:DUF3482 domain-containing protein [Saccharospirillum impatiens]
MTTNSSSTALTPVFAVVGHPNQGKSSLVSTLTQDDHIAVSPVSGTTREAHRYQLMFGQTVLYELIDTPGFQRARQIIDWCERHSDSAAGRPDALRRFVGEHRHDPKFADDCALLVPVLAGAGIVYVVDTSQRFDATFEAELTVLSWTAQPRLALLNPMRETGNEADWQVALQQYFSLVRTFNPLQAPFESHLALLRSMAEIHLPWRDGLKRSVEALSEQRQQRHQHSAEALVLYLQNVLQHRLRLPLAGPKEQLKTQGLAQFNRDIQRQEQQLQGTLAEYYGHRKLDWKGEWQSLATDDLLDAHEWRAWGLSRARLASLSGAAGAASGLVVDAAVGGASLLLGAVVGGTLGGLAGGFAGRDPLSFEVLSRVPGYEQWQLGPVSNLEFALALAGRSLRSWYQMRCRNHARRDAVMLKQSDLSRWLDGLGRKQQVQWVYWVRKMMKRSLTESEQSQLMGLILALGEQMDKPESD